MFLVLFGNLLEGITWIERFGFCSYANTKNIGSSKEKGLHYFGLFSQCESGSFMQVINFENGLLSIENKLLEYNKLNSFYAEVKIKKFWFFSFVSR